jgi:cob(I)alamin adenosyltransferase
MNGAIRKIYTRRGDRGETTLLSGETVKKDDPRVKTYGSLDEFQSHLGNLFPLTRDESVRAICFRIQDDIFVASSELASTPGALPKLKRRISEKDVSKLEGWIDEFTASYGLPDRFVVPINSQAGAALNVARAVCRRCERLIVTMDQKTGVYGELVMYFNRLSDLLFVLAWSIEIKTVVEKVIRDLLEWSES